MRTLPSGKCYFAAMFLQTTVMQCVDWLNQHIKLHEDCVEMVTEAVFYPVFAVVCYSPDTGFL